jgi:GTP-binding protein YchF
MSLSIGIVGLPNVGKSTLFNALLKKQQAYAANFPFATIEPNIGIVPVPDERLTKLAEVTKEADKLEKLPPEVQATVEFVDIAGLIAGAHKGEGLGNKFLSHIREVDAICHVVRLFTDADIVKEGSVDPDVDFSVIETELLMSDLATVEGSLDRSKKATEVTKSALTKLKEALAAGKPAREVVFTEPEALEARQLHLLTAKPILVALNCDEDSLKDSLQIETTFATQNNLLVDQVVAISARTEEQLSGFTDEEAASYLADLGVNKSGLERLIKKGFSTLGLISFLTAGEKEVRAWTIKKGITAQMAAGVIHNDFVKKFIKADVVDYESFVSLVGWKACREQGKVRSEGRDYIMKDGDIVEFKIGA